MFDAYIAARLPYEVGGVGSINSNAARELYDPCARCLSILTYIRTSRTNAVSRAPTPIPEDIISESVRSKKNICAWIRLRFRDKTRSETKAVTRACVVFPLVALKVVNVLLQSRYNLPLFVGEHCEPT